MGPNHSIIRCLTSTGHGAAAWITHSRLDTSYDSRTCRGSFSIRTNMVGHELRVGDAVLLDESQHRLGVEPAHQDRRRTHPVDRHRVVDARRVVQRRRATGTRSTASSRSAAMSACSRTLCAHEPLPSVGKRTPHRLGSSGGARRVQHLGAVRVRRRVTGVGDRVLVGPPTGELTSHRDADVDTDRRRRCARCRHRRVDEHRPRLGVLDDVERLRRE